MNGARSWMLYGAAGHTGALIARHAYQRGHRPLLAGRSAPAIAALAGDLDLPYRALTLDDPAALDAALAATARQGPGIAASVQENFPYGGWTRRAGHLHPQALGSGTITITLPGGPCRIMPFPTGDLEAAFQATGAPDITAYSPVPDDPAPRSPSLRYRACETPGLPVGRVGASRRPGRRHRRSVAANRRVLCLYRRRQHPRHRGNSRAIRARSVQPGRGVRRRLRPHHPGHYARVQPGLIPIDGGHRRAAALKHEHEHRRRRVRHRYRPARSPPAAPVRRRQDAGRGGGRHRPLTERGRHANPRHHRGAGSIHRRRRGPLHRRLAADPRGRRRPAGRRGVDRRPPGRLPLNPASNLT